MERVNMSMFFFFKQKTAYELRISDWSSDVCSSDLIGTVYPTKDIRGSLYVDAMLGKHFALLGSTGTGKSTSAALILHKICELAPQGHIVMIDPRSEEHTSELQSLMRISYAVFCLKKKKKRKTRMSNIQNRDTHIQRKVKCTER